MAVELNISNGKKDYVINGCEVTFNPTDLYFMERLFGVFIVLEDKKDELESTKAQIAKDNSVEGLKELFAVSRRYDEEMREMLDGVVSAPISQAVAEDVNIYAASDDDTPIYARILFLLMDQMDAGVSKMARNANPRIEKYLAKYNGRKA